MEQHLTEKELEKIRNKKYPDNQHLLIIDRAYNGSVRPCICDTDFKVHYYMEDRSASPANTNIFIFDPDGNEAAHIREIPVKTAMRNNKIKDLFPCRFNISLGTEPAGFIRIDLLSMGVHMDHYENCWQIEYSDKRSLGYDYKYTVWKHQDEAAHFRSKVLKQKPVYILDHKPGQDELFLIILFIIHSIYTNKKPLHRNIKKNDRLARMKGLLGL